MAVSELVPLVLLEQVADRFRLLGDPVRLQLLNLLHLHGEMTVQALAEASEQSHANTSKHLRLMAEAGMVARRQEGLYAFYEVADPSLSGVCLLMCGQVQL